MARCSDLRPIGTSRRLRHWVDTASSGQERPPPRGQARGRRRRHRGGSLLPAPASTPPRWAAKNAAHSVGHRSTRSPLTAWAARRWRRCRTVQSLESPRNPGDGPVADGEPSLPRPFGSTFGPHPSNGAWTTSEEETSLWSCDLPSVCQRPQRCERFRDLPTLDFD